MSSQSDQRHRRFLDLYSKSQPRVYAFILMLVHNKHDADEIFQDTSALLWEKFDKYQEDASFGAWAVSIAKFQVYEYMRQSKKQKSFLNSELLEDIAQIAEPESTNVTDRIAVLQKCLYKLDRISRSLLSLRYQKNVSVKEIAERKGVSAGVMYRKMTKIFGILRRCVNLSIAKNG